MALATLPLKLPVAPSPFTSPSRIRHPNRSLLFKSPYVGHSFHYFHRKLAITNAKSRSGVTTPRAVEESQESTESEAEMEAQSSVETGDEVKDLGAEIKKAMMERKEEKEGDLFSGVAEEVQEIEWPAFGKVLGTTGVVLGVIAGSSVALLTVNAVLAELSDRVFGGRGVQDFFG